MYRRKGSDFEMMEEEGILRVRNENQAKTGKSQNLRQKEKGKGKKGQDAGGKKDQNRLRQGKIKS